MSKKEIIEMLKSFQRLGFENIRATKDLILLNNNKKTMPLELINEFNYFTQSEKRSIINEITRLENELNNFSN